jgi:hypothetical protein
LGVLVFGKRVFKNTQGRACRSRCVSQYHYP